MKNKNDKFENPNSPLSYHEEVELVIDNLSHEGRGVGRVEDWVVMVPFTLPGERVKARIYRCHSNYSEADLMEVLEASPNRVDAPCQYFGECGGCQYQHLAYSEQLKVKERNVAEVLKRIGCIEIAVNEAVGSPKQYHYRSKLTPHYPGPRGKNDFPVGFLKSGTRSKLVDVERCVIATEAINEAFPVIRKELRATLKNKKKGGTVFIRESEEGVTTESNEVVTERVNGLVFQHRAGDFFQNNPFIIGKMVDYAVEAAVASGAKYLIDAYCGSGLFTLSASKHFESCAGVEVSAKSIQWAQINAELNKVSNCDFIIGDAAEIFKEVTFPGSDTAMIIDPPRKGCDEVFLNQLIEFGPKTLVYVSCEASTQARDLKYLLEQGGYKLESITPFDLFPQTRHIETVAILSKVI